MLDRLPLILSVILIILTMIFIVAYMTLDEETETTWAYHESVEEAGWNPEQLIQARNYYESINSTALMVIHEGKVLLSWGDVTTNTNAHSVRKSFLSALYGIEWEKGTFALDDTLADYDIEEEPPLSGLELRAQLQHLLSSTSGVYLPAGEESWNMRQARPARGTRIPGSYYYYNNWDFNVLGSIYNEQTERDLFEDFHERIAVPLGMEDFSLGNTNYKYENRRSLHPSYLFRMSARDFARFGQLYLQNGEWEGEQIVPEEWIELSTQPHAEVASNNIFDYGYLWWSATAGIYEELGMFSAVGRYGQSIEVIPEYDLVFVHRVDSNHHSFSMTRDSVNDLQRLQLLQLILDAKRTE
ncbi:serine hydrolase domain-containing protein [Salisediminibacterium selenitireducens]|uniref:Beta-lactamase n=1 Tax=Bacillus selenitireducens (strain ATCC 700615 / DSM 15326 / MLS10) TaxID=439292 RepID=D6XUG0_BACIE|nr:serine hydrolase [Salisediminibacterium selenitireducens]ADH99446.1 beta-lactamase [[Bacillus] selenitireducens MLS10]